MRPGVQAIQQKVRSLNGLKAVGGGLQRRLPSRSQATLPRDTVNSLFGLGRPGPEMDITVMRL